VVSIIRFGFSGSAYAGNGTRLLGFSARDSGMAGATTASSEDTSCLVRNPAGLVRIGNRIDAEYLNLLPHDVTMHTEGPANVIGAQPLANVDHRQKSTINYIPAEDVGISYRIPGTDKYPVAVGCGIFSMAGIALNYPCPRINQAFVGAYDRMMYLVSTRIAPGIAVAFNDKLSFGATGNIGLQGIKSDLATSTFDGANFTYPETAGSSKWDFVPGGGFTVGLLYQFNKMLGLGASFESPTWMGHHYKYKDTLPVIDEPPVMNVGLSFKPVKNFEFTYDTRYINWTNVKLAGEGPGNGGFGWQDQWVFAVGGEYTFKDKKDNDKFKFRLGYNYGKSPVQPHVVFANALLPIIMEHHLTTGFSYFLTRDLSFDFVWEHHFKNFMVDNGTGDQYSRFGAGTEVTAAADVIGVGLGYKY
ncbi:MAG: outer membrane protein transport protein, partial [Candidatus Omnitrophica bacterium]|nr:outer membrane protein transport protein [Candidatus Omnitrophota bacterium]